MRSIGEQHLVRTDQLFDASRCAVEALRKTRNLVLAFHQAAEKRGKGVLLLTGHFGGWEVGSFFHSLQGHPMQIVVRPLDNPYVDTLVTRYRGLYPALSSA